MIVQGNLLATLKAISTNTKKTKLEIKVTLTFDPTNIGSTEYEKIRTDFEGTPIPKDGNAMPGPFQSLRAGKNIFKVWNGLPLLEKGELPIKQK